MNFRFKFLLLATLILQSPLAHSASLFAPFTLDSAETLPHGVRNFAVAGFTTDITDGQNGWGTVQPIGGGFNKNITWSDLIRAQKAGYERDSLQGYVQSKNYGMNDVVGRSAGVVDTRVTATVPVLAYGITDNFTLAAVVPILYSNTNVSTGWRNAPTSMLRASRCAARAWVAITRRAPPATNSGWRR